jgi:hypothetical protein
MGKIADLWFQRLDLPTGNGATRNSHLVTNSEVLPGCSSTSGSHDPLAIGSYQQDL